MKDSHASAQPTLCLSPSHADDTVTSPLNSRTRRKPLGALLSLVNTLESTRSKISRSRSSLARSMSQMSRFADFASLAKPDDVTSDEFDDTNETTLNDEDLMSSPTQKGRACSPPPSLFHPSALLPEHFMSNEHLPNSSISTFSVPQDQLPRIDEAELFKIILGDYASQFDEYIIIDCRFPYEFDGGHIANAINIPLQVDLEERFVVNHPKKNHTRLLIFHCEYSIFRGPTMASHLRKVDRIYNSDRYPYLLYPDIVVLEGGYKRFFDKHKHMCEPQGYVEMKDIKHKRTCEVEMNKVIQASKLTRAKSFNQFQPKFPPTHTRSTSFTALLSTSEHNLAPTSTPAIRRNRSSKIHKKRDGRPNSLLFTQSLLSLSNMDSPKNDSPVSASFDNDDFAPPPLPALFRSHSKSLSNLLVSVHSSQLLVCSESYSSAFSSTDSLLDSCSPFAESSEYFDQPTAMNNSGNLLSGNVTSNTSISSPFSFPKYNGYSSTPARSNGSTPTGNPMPNLKNKARLTLSRPNIRPTALALSSPTISSPLSATPASTFETPASNHTLMAMDDINDTPVDFSFGIRSHARLFSFANGMYSNLNALDIDEADEESD